MSVKIEKFGELPDGRTASLYHLKNHRGFEVCVTDFGVNIQSILVRNCRGEKTDVALGFDHLEDYLENNGMFGATVGRNVNRISNAEFQIDGIKYHLAKNRGKHNIHSDKEHGFHKVLWDAEVIDENAVRFSYISPDGEQGFPGELKVSVMGLSFITEGAIPFAAGDPLHILPPCIIGSAVAGALSMAFGCGLPAPHGGIFVIGVITNPLMYLAAIAAGAVIGMLIMSVTKRPLKK